MFIKFFILFTIFPIIEIFLLIKLSNLFGTTISITIIIITGILGAYLLKIEGLRTLYKIIENVKNGNRPQDEILEAISIFFASVVLITPGLITDLLGLILLIPLTRIKIITLIKKFFYNKFKINKEDYILHQD